MKDLSFTRTNYQPVFIVNSHGVYRLSDFLVLYDRRFVRAAYAAILRREPDPNGETHYLNRVRTGEHRALILEDILGSDEARKHRTVIHGLHEYLRRMRSCNRPVIGKFVAAYLFLLNLDEHMRDLRILENHMIRMAEEGEDVQESNLRKLRSFVK